MLVQRKVKKVRRVFQAERTASAKALRWEHAWYVQGTERRQWDYSISR